MRDYIDKAKGLANETAGKAKVRLGRVKDAAEDVLAEGKAIKKAAKRKSAPRRARIDALY